MRGNGEAIEEEVKEAGMRGVDDGRMVRLQYRPVVRPPLAAGRR